MKGETAGRLDERVTLERWRSQRDAAGDDFGQWVAVDTRFAAVIPDGQPGQMAAGAAARSGRRWRVVMRDAGDLDLLVRLRWRDQLLAVRGVERDPRRRDFATLFCDGQPA